MSLKVTKINSIEDAQAFCKNNAIRVMPHDVFDSYQMNYVRLETAEQIKVECIATKVDLQRRFGSHRQIDVTKLFGKDEDYLLGFFARIEDYLLKDCLAIYEDFNNGANTGKAVNL